MPQLDVSDVLNDPMFFDTFTVTRNTLVMVNGRATVTTQTFKNIRGVVTSNDDDRRTLIPEGQRKNSTINIHTKFALTDGNDGVTDADVVTYNGRQFVVTTVGDYSRFGAGFYFVTADLNRTNP